MPPSRNALAQAVTEELPAPTISETSAGVNPASWALTASSFTSGEKSFRCFCGDGVEVFDELGGNFLFLGFFFQSAITFLLLPARDRSSLGGRVTLFQAGLPDITSWTLHTCSFILNSPSQNLESRRSAYYTQKLMLPDRPLHESISGRKVEFAGFPYVTQLSSFPDPSPQFNITTHYL
jgi:hypothetical protein